jgi:hypothetical protein
MSRHDEECVAAVSTSMPRRKHLLLSPERPRFGNSRLLVPARIRYQDWQWNPQHKPCCSPLTKLAGHFGVSFVSAGRVIICNSLATSISESTFRKDDCRKETLRAVFWMLDRIWISFSSHS